MGRGRRLALLDQATLVWGVYGDAVDREWYVETGMLGGASKQLPPNPLADKIAAHIEQTGRLVVDPELFEQWRKEIAGNPLQ